MSLAFKEQRQPINLYLPFDPQTHIMDKRQQICRPYATDKRRRVGGGRGAGGDVILMEKIDGRDLAGSHHPGLRYNRQCGAFSPDVPVYHQSVIYAISVTEIWQSFQRGATVNPSSVIN